MGFGSLELKNPLLMSKFFLEIVHIHNYVLTESLKSNLAKVTKNKTGKLDYAIFAAEISYIL
jgi:hypothetical protein